MENTNTNTNTDKLRILYFTPEKTYIKLSGLIKDDSNNYMLKESGGICIEEKKKEEGGVIKQPKIRENKLNHPLTKSPVQHIIKFIIRDILLYLPDERIISDCLILNKQINSMFEITLENRNFKFEKELIARNNANVVYTEFEISDYVKPNERLFDVDLKVSTKDQGWSSANVSSSWVEMVFQNTEGDSVFPLAKNFRERNWKTVQLISSCLKNSNCDKRIFNNFANMNNKVQIKARSMFPGWECHINSFEIEFRVLKVKRN